MNNKKEFLALIEKYESITIEEIEKVWHREAGVTANSLTGYGRSESCILCRAVDVHCFQCEWVKLTLNKCSRGDNFSSYALIADVKTPEQLRQAFVNRTKHMKEVLKNEQ